MSAAYNDAHWSKKITEYFDEEWSHLPTPFARLVAKYVVSGSRILELGAGAGQDGIWFAGQGNQVILSDASDEQFAKIRTRIPATDADKITFKVIDVAAKLDFDDNSVDVVYAHLVLHYFDNAGMTQIMSEIRRILKPGGVLACMVNTMSDDEYDSEVANGEDIIEHNGVAKRYFSESSFAQFTTGFNTLLLNSEGRTPKDDAVGNSGMIQFVGKKHE